MDMASAGFVEGFVGVLKHTKPYLASRHYLVKLPSPPTVCNLYISALADLTRIATSVETVRGQLYQNEEIITDKDNVGLYDGKEKTVSFDNGRIYLTTHRVIYVDAADPHRNSRSLDLTDVKQTEHWSGFMKSSPKITLVLHDSRSVTPLLAETAAVNGVEIVGSTWACHVCGFRNTTSGGTKCMLCGVSKLANAYIQVAQPSASALTSNYETQPHPTTAGDRISCPTCTFLNHLSMIRCEMCDSPLGTHSTRPSRPVSLLSNTASRPSTPLPVGVGGENFVKLSFRKGGDKAFYISLKHTLQSKRWDSEDPKTRLKDNAVREAADSKSRQNKVGIEGLLNNIDLDSKDREGDMQEALSDLEALMQRAKDMVNLAQSLSTKLATADAAGVTSDADSVETVVKRSLMSLGLGAPAVTAELSADEAEYRLGLAKELASVLLGDGRTTGRTPLMRNAKSSQGILRLDEVWCLWNRARGIALVSPKDLKDAVGLLPSLTRSALRLRTFASGLAVLYTPFYSEESFAERVCSLVMQHDTTSATAAASTVDIAQSEGLSVALTQLMLELVEGQDRSRLVRDEGDPRQGVRWQVNHFEVLERQCQGLSNVA